MTKNVHFQTFFKRGITKSDHNTGWGGGLQKIWVDFYIFGTKEGGLNFFQTLKVWGVILFMSYWQFLFNKGPFRKHY